MSRRHLLLLPGLLLGALALTGCNTATHAPEPDGGIGAYRAGYSSDNDIYSMARQIAYFAPKTDDDIDFFAQSVCDDLANDDFAFVVASLTNDEDQDGNYVTENQAGVFVGASVANYCPEQNYYVEKSQQ